MTQNSAPTLVKWPFLLADFVFLGLAALIVNASDRPMALWQIAFCFVCVAAGAGLSVTPFLQEYRAAVRLTETDTLNTTLAQIQNLDLISGQIQSATRQWQTVQEQSTQTAAAAKEIAQRISTEARAFTEFMQRANDSE